MNSYMRKWCYVHSSNFPFCKYCLSTTDMTYKDTFHVDPETYWVIFPKTKHLYQAFSFLLGGQPLSKAMDLFREDLFIYLRKSAHRLERQGEGERISSWVTSQTPGSISPPWAHNPSWKKPRLGHLAVVPPRRSSDGFICNAYTRLCVGGWTLLTQSSNMPAEILRCPATKCMHVAKFWQLRWEWTWPANFRETCLMWADWASRATALLECGCDNWNSSSYLRPSDDIENNMVE